MDIFGRIISSEDAKLFCKLSEAEKRAWITKYTKQTNDELITDFINNPPKNHGCGCGCGGKKVKKDDYISSGVSQEIAKSSELNSIEGANSGNSVKRQRATKKKKD